MNCVTINSPIEKLEKPMDVQVNQLFIQLLYIYRINKIIAYFQMFFDFDFSKAEILEMFMEVHTKHQSRMNRAWGMDNIFLIKVETGGLWQLFTYTVSLVQKEFAICLDLYIRFNLGYIGEEDQHKKISM